MFRLYCLGVLLISLHQAYGQNLITYKIPITTEIKKALGYPEGTYLNFTELTSKNGYLPEQHEVTTDDGYILTIFRLNSPKCTTFDSNPILLLHGFFLNSDEWLNAGPGVGWAYILADACQDVWVGNNRGNNYSRRHKTLNPDKDAKFWDFSIDEFGIYDFPAMVDHILNTTGKAKANPIGYALGEQLVLIALSTKPEYNNKIDTNIVLASSSTFGHIKSIPLRLLATILYIFEKPLRAIGINEVLFKYSVLQVLLEFLCQDASFYPQCSLLLGLIDSQHPGSLSANVTTTFFSSFISGSSIKMAVQFFNNVLKNGLYKYDYGAEGNLAKYGTASVPQYNVSAVVAPSIILHGLNDFISVPQDVNTLAGQLPNLLEQYVVPDPLWNHFDSGWGTAVKTVLLPKVLQYVTNSSLPTVPTKSSIISTVVNSILP